MTRTNDPTGPIAIFDSGVGGLTVLHECLVTLPHEDFVYFGDTARFPYGDRTPDQLRAFSLEIADDLVAHGAKALVVACNSATSAALGELESAYGDWLPVTAVVRPESRLAAAATRNGRIGLLATSATVASGAYERALADAAPDATLIPVACPALTPLIQAGGEIDHRVVELVDEYTRPLIAAGVDTVILGCTHYPLVRPVIQRALGRGVQLVSSGEAIAEEVDAKLREADLASAQDRRGSYRFLCSGDTAEFRRLAARFIQLPLGEIEQVDVATAVRPPRGVAV
ncbi:MAG: glutamate racemase [Thermoleophilaceae bacterium]|nr:glutamate racemase [Thermoleophilaceae bacterium]